MTILGVDISHHNTADMLSLADGGVGFVIAKSSEGTAFVDPTYAKRAIAAHDVGMPFAAYHYLRSDSPGRSQAIHAMSVVGQNVPIALDIETDSSNGHPTMAQAIEFTDQVWRMGGKVSLWYLPYWYWHGYWNAAPLPSSAPPLWQSIYPAGNYSGTARDRYRLVGGDAGVGWAIMASHRVAVWQYGSNGRVPGVSFPVDLDAYRGDARQLAESGIVTFWGRASTPAPISTALGKASDMLLVEAQTGVALIVAGKWYSLNTEIVQSLRSQGVPFVSFKDQSVSGLYALGTDILENTPHAS